MKTLKDIHKMLNEPRPLTDEEQNYKHRKQQMRKEAKAKLRVAALPFQPPKTIVLAFNAAGELEKK